MRNRSHSIEKFVGWVGGQIFQMHSNERSATHPPDPLNPLSVAKNIYNSHMTHIHVTMTSQVHELKQLHN